MLALVRLKSRQGKQADFHLVIIFLDINAGDTLGFTSIRLYA
jgi:hypothetical protein